MESKKTKFNKPLITFSEKAEGAYDYAKKIGKLLIDKGYVEFLYVEEIEKLNTEKVYGNNSEDKEKYFKKFNIENDDSNLCISIGGDTSCLLANALYKDKERPPFLCFHKGNLGFLSLYEPANYEEILDELYSNEENFSYMERKLIECEMHSNEKIIEKLKESESDKEQQKIKKEETKFMALNDITVERENSMLTLDIEMDNEFLATVVGDGLILSTPSGSTAYCSAAGGPIMHNNVNGLILVCICPFSLSFRPIVLPPETKIKIKNKNIGNLAKIIYDGKNAFKMDNKNYLEVCLSNKKINFIILRKIIKSIDRIWIDKLSQNLGWNQAFKHF